MPTQTNLISEEKVKLKEKIARLKLIICPVGWKIHKKFSRKVI